MAIVLIHPDFEKGLRGEEALDLAKAFAVYKDAPDEHFGDVFGRDRLAIAPPQAVAERIHHVHMETDDVRDRWDWLVLNPRSTPHDFTSDLIVFYVRLNTCNEINVFGLLAIYYPPHGHSAISSHGKILDVYPSLLGAARDLRVGSLEQVKAIFPYVDTTPKKRRQVRVRMEDIPPRS